MTGTNLGRLTQALIKGKEAGLITEQEYIKEAKSLYDNFSIRYVTVNQSSDMISRLVYSFDEEIISAYQDFVKVMEMYIVGDSAGMDNELSIESTEESDVDGIAWILLTRQAGKFHKALRDKLISIRE
jgi:hypothetical protein